MIEDKNPKCHNIIYIKYVLKTIKKKELSYLRERTREIVLV